MSQPEASADLASLQAEPDGALHLTPEQRAAMAVMRGVHVPPFELSLSRFGGKNTPASAQPLVDAVSEILRPRDADTPATRAARDPLLGEDQTWREMLQHQIHFGDHSAHSLNTWLINTLMMLRGIPAAARFVLDTLADADTDQACNFEFGDRFLPALLRLRHAIATLPDADHTPLAAHARSLAGRSVSLDYILALLLPELAQPPMLATGEPPANATQLDPAGAHTPMIVSRPYVSLSLGHALNLPLLLAMYKQPYGWSLATYHKHPDHLALLLHLHGKATLPVFAALLDRLHDDKTEQTALERVLDVLMTFEHPAVLDLLLAHRSNAMVFAHLSRACTRWPLLLRNRLLAQPGDAAVQRLLAQLLARTPELADFAVASLDDAQRNQLTRLASRQPRHADAPLATLPPALATPAWHSARRPAAPVLDLPLHALAPVLHASAVPPLDPLEMQHNRHHLFRTFDQRTGHKRRADLPPVEIMLQLCGLTPQRARSVAQGEGELHSGDFPAWVSEDYAVSLTLLRHLPDALAVQLFDRTPAGFWRDNMLNGQASEIPRLIARFGLAGLDGLLRLGSDLFAHALAFETERFAPLAAQALAGKRTRGHATRWLQRYPERAARGLLPLAFGKKGKPRTQAAAALRWLQQHGHADALRRAAAQHDATVQQAVAEFLAIDAWQEVPAKMPELPAWLVLDILPRPLLRTAGSDGQPRAVPPAQLGDLALMFALSTPETPYAGLEQVRAVVTLESLAEFAWELSEQWLAAGAPAKDNWAFHALALVGTNDTARRLTPLIRRWPGESAHARAVAGLEILAAIGSDVALMHLNGIAETLKFKGLQNKARELIAQIAEDRALSPAQLADRLVPDLSLDERGTLTLDFGPRQFTVGFDETLQPFVRDADGKRFKNLPRANSKDDAALAEDASARWKALKKDARALATLQIGRLEQAMVSQRRWTVDEFQPLFVVHPLSRHLAQRLVWGIYDAADTLRAAFRIAEDLSLLDAADAVFTLPADARIGIAHTIDLTADARAAFGQIFSDYELLQPFPQLARATFALTAEERASTTLTRFAARKVASTALMGLIQHGWERCAPQDAGIVRGFTKPLGPRLHLHLALDPGLSIGAPDIHPVQTLPRLTLGTRRDDYGGKAELPFSTLNAIQASEMLRDVGNLPETEE